MCLEHKFLTWLLIVLTYLPSSASSIQWGNLKTSFQYVMHCRLLFSAVSGYLASENTYRHWYFSCAVLHAIAHFCWMPERNKVFFFLFNSLRHTDRSHEAVCIYSTFTTRNYLQYTCICRLTTCAHLYRNAKKKWKGHPAVCYEADCYVSRHGDTYSYRQLAFVLEPKPGAHFTHAFNNIIGHRGKQHYSLMRVLFECERQTFMFAQYIDDYWSFYASCNWRRLEVRWCPYV